MTPRLKNTIAAINAMYGTSYKTIGEIPIKVLILISIDLKILELSGSEKEEKPAEEEPVDHLAGLR